MSLPSRVSVDAVVDPEDVLRDLDNEDISDYLEEQGYRMPASGDNSPVSEIDYYHGDFDLKSFFKKLGLEEVRKVLKEVEEELA